MRSRRRVRRVLLALSAGSLAAIAATILLEAPETSVRRESSMWDFCPAAEAGEPAPVDDVVPGYVGSDSCASCHAKEYGEWRASLHSKMEQAASPKSVLGAWSSEGTVVATEAAGRRVVMIREGDSYYVEAPGPDAKPARFAVDRTIGNRYKQIYLTKFPDGSWHPLPVVWFQKDAMFKEWLHLASREPGSGKFWADPPWQWQLKCAGCHTTGLDLGYDTEKKTYATRWKDLSIGCESCHGPGKAHVAAKGGKDNVLCPSKFTHVQQNETCGKCHSRGSAGPEQGAPKGLPARLAYPYNMLPGSSLDAQFVQVQPEKNPQDFKPDVTAFQFWPDGHSFNHHQQLTDYRRSPMFLHGGDRAPTCTSCHEPHRAADLKLPISDNSLCLSCHTGFREATALAKHTGHGSDPAANAGARCVECHMPRIVNHAGSERLRSHTYWSPNPSRAPADSVTPLSCLLCHTDKDRAWAAAAADRIWPPKQEPLPK